eukprot:m.75819 g.75819  ORF g.75819 m.75819 type:complete len:458 (+) comp10452_c0_seq4:158-1531(+)
MPKTTKSKREKGAGPPPPAEPTRDTAAARFDMLAAQMQRLRADAPDAREGADGGGSGRGGARGDDGRSEGHAAHVPADARSSLDALDSALSAEPDVATVPRQRKPKGAYRFTSLLQKLQKWRMLITRALLELDKPADLPAEASDPLWAQNRLDTAWKDAKGQLEEILKGGAAIVSVSQYAAASRKSDSLDYPVVEEQMVRILKNMAPLVTTAKVAAALDETVGAGRNLIRRTKAICTAIGKLMSVLESPAGSASAVCAQILEAVGHLDDACKVVLKAACKGTEDARKTAIEERNRARDAERRALAQAKQDELSRRKAKREAELTAIRKEREAADRELEEARHICEQQNVASEERIRRIREEAEAQYLAEALKDKSIQIRERIQPPDLTVDGFTPSAEGIYDTGTAVREGFSADTRDFAAEESAAEAQKRAYIERLRAKHSAAAVPSDDDSDSDGIAL